MQNFIVVYVGCGSEIAAFQETAVHISQPPFMCNTPIICRVINAPTYM